MILAMYLSIDRSIWIKYEECDRTIQLLIGQSGFRSILFSIYNFRLNYRYSSTLLRQLNLTENIRIRIRISICILVIFNYVNNTVWFQGMSVYFRDILTFPKSCLNYAINFVYIHPHRCYLRCHPHRQSQHEPQKLPVVAVSQMWKAAKMQAGKFHSALCYRGILASVCVCVWVNVMQTKFKLCTKNAIYKFVARIWGHFASNANNRVAAI